MNIWQPHKVIVPEQRLCRYCGANITGTACKTICSSPVCKKRARRDDYYAKKDILKQKRTRYPHVCPTCGKPFNGTKTQVYCSRKCARLKMHKYHDIIAELHSKGYDFDAIAEEIDGDVRSVRYYYKHNIESAESDNS